MAIQDVHSVYTRRVKIEEFNMDEELKICPVLLQEEISRLADIRVTFIGGACFGARITTFDASDIVDWRKPDQALQYLEEDVPIDIRDKCLAMMRHWHLNYAAFDFIEDLDGNWVFLEINPVGEWAWLEEQLGFEMREAFIELFYKNR